LELFPVASQAPGSKLEKKGLASVELGTESRKKEIIASPPSAEVWWT